MTLLSCLLFALALPTTFINASIYEVVYNKFVLAVSTVHKTALKVGMHRKELISPSTPANWHGV